jgi:hypothetical protein
MSHTRLRAAIIEDRASESGPGGGHAVGRRCHRDRARRGLPPSGLRQVEDIRVLRGSAAASCLAMSNHRCPPRGRGRRYAA